MPGFARDELESMVKRFVDANDEAGQSGQWSKMADFYTEDAVYTWNNGPGFEFVARGRDQIRDWVFGTEMEGLEHWTYPYVRTLIDDQKGEVLGLWRQIAPVSDPDGKPYEIAGTGGSWFRYGGNGQWCWQRDFFDHHNVGDVLIQMARNQQLTPALAERMKKGSKMPGWVERKTYDWYSEIVDPGT
jgi:ketosteroid isomerase-like protein